MPVQKLDDGECVANWPAARLYDLAVRQQGPGVVEGDDTVAEQAPALLGMGGDNTSRVAVHCVAGGADGLVRAGHMDAPGGGRPKVTGVLGVAGQNDRDVTRVFARQPVTGRDVLIVTPIWVTSS